MTIQPYARVNPSTIVTNIVQWDGVTPFNVSPDTLVSAVSQPNAQIGGTYVGGVFTAPSAPPPAQGQTFVNSPTTGATIQIPAPPPSINGAPQTLYIALQPAGNLASLTLALPTAPVTDGTTLLIFSSKAVTAFNFTGGPANNAPTALNALQQFSLTWSQQNQTWFHFGPVY